MDTLNDVFTNRRRHNNLLVCRLNWNVDTVSTEPSETQRPSLTCHLSHTHTHTHTGWGLCVTHLISNRWPWWTPVNMKLSCFKSRLKPADSRLCSCLTTSSSKPPHLNVSGCFLRLRPGVSCDCVLRFEHGLNKVLGQSSLGQKHHSLVFRDPSRFLPV